MRRLALLALLLLIVAPPAPAQVGNCASLDRLNRRLGGRVIDYTHNHGEDRRLPSSALGAPRDLYVYLPPGYTPARAYPLVLYFHTAYIDEHTFVASDRIVELDRLIAAGGFPPAVVACVDGLIDGENRIRGPHSFYVDGVSGRFEDFVTRDVLPALYARYSIRPEPGAHALLGVSAGGYGAMSLALRRRDLFGTVATIASPLNLRYGDARGYFADFDPRTYRPEAEYDPDQVIGRFYFGLRRTRARTYIGPVFGEGPAVVDRVVRTNPADQLALAGVRPGELAIYVAYAGRDNFNFDAQAESFLWLAAGRGIAVTAVTDPKGRHGIPFFRANHLPAFRWMAGHLLPPLGLAAR